GTPKAPGRPASGVERLDLGSEMLKAYTALELERRRHLSGFEGEVAGQDCEPLDLLVARQLAVHFVDRALYRRLGARRVDVVREDLARGLLVLEVAPEDRVGLDQDLAVVGDAQLHAWKRRPDAPEAVARRAIDRRTRRALGQAVALEDEYIERCEKLDDLLGE